MKITFMYSLGILLNVFAFMYACMLIILHKAHLYFCLKTHTLHLVALEEAAGELGHHTNRQAANETSRQPPSRQRNDTKYEAESLPNRQEPTEPPRTPTAVIL